MEELMKTLIEEKKYADFRKLAGEMNEADIASILEELPVEEFIRFFRFLPKDRAADVFSYLPIETQQQLITSFTDTEASSIVENLFSDDAADLLEEMPANFVKRILEKTSPETRRTINQLLKYPEDSAGSIMTTEFLDLKEYMTVEQAIARIRHEGIDKETLSNCYVLDKSRALVGAVALRSLVFAKSDDLVKDIMEDHVISVSTHMDQEEVARIIQKYDFSAIPVVDSENRLVGIITVDDVVDILQQEATEDIEKMAAITPSDKPYNKTGVFETWKKRVPWLLLLMVSATFTGMIISYYEEALGTYTVLTSFIPMIMDTCGNAGSQASVSIIRALSLEEIKFKDLPATVWKEIRVSLLIGATLAATNFVKLLVIDRVGVVIALVVCLTLIATVFLSKVVGATLPMLVKKIGFDPAVTASPFITTIVDALSLVVYFQFATLLLDMPV
ncbi:MAG: magnesium transporter [Lachnospiraceae bacterium]|nr:magnesium transporter [Lachnospiraceae bacterium]